MVLADADGRRVRFLGTTRWCDFDLFGAARREQAHARRDLLRARDAGHARRRAVRPRGGARGGASPAAPGWRASWPRPADGWDATVVVTHYAPSLRSADPRYGAQPTTASFCNADDDLLPRGRRLAARPPALPPRLPRWRGRTAARTRVVCNARGLDRKGEPDGYDPLRLIEV